MNLQILLEQLADGEFHSGSAIGSALGVSRTAVWKSLSQLSELGLSVESIKGKGYRLPYAVELLDKAKICALTDGAYLSRIGLNVLLSTPSTNAHLTGSSVCAEYDVCLAEHQSEGRGRRGRSWVSPFGRNIYMSVAFDLQGGVEALSGLSLVIGIAVVRALRSVGVADAKLKWPNDVWIADRKVCGILVELQGEATTGWRVIAGLGVNVSMSGEDAAVDQIEQAWTSVADYVAVERNLLVSRLLTELIDVIDVFRAERFSAFVREWADMDALFGKPVTINGGEIDGISEGVDVHGNLMVRVENNALLSVNAGEVSVRCR